MTRRVATVLCPMARLSARPGLASRDPRPVTAADNRSSRASAMRSPMIDWYIAAMPASSVTAGCDGRTWPASSSS